MNFIKTLILILLSTSILLGQNTYPYTTPAKLNDGWETSNLQAQGIDTSRIYHLLNQLQEADHHIHSLLLIKDRQIILEEYYDGHQISQPHDLRSVTKSIRSLLMGIAIDKGYIESVDDPITKYLKTPVATKNLDLRKQEITIRHLLTMSTGLDCNDWDKKSKGQEDKVYKKEDWLQYTLDLPMINDPGKVSAYCSMGAILTAEIISQASGMSIDLFAEKYLFSPLGITNVSWGHTSKKKVIPSAKRLYMTSRDLAKMGQLILNRGKWHDQQIVSENWIHQATTPATKITGMDYGFFWWNIPFQTPNKAYISKVATGNGGQYMMIFPDLQMIAVFTGGAYNSPEDKLPFTIVNNVFLPALEGKND
jgi:CubicO group peptidase (beta-lactamase class C family)